LGRDLGALHEAPQIDVARLARRERLELLVGHDREAAVVLLVAAHELIPCERPLLGRTVITPRERLAIRAEHAQRDAIRARGREEVDGHADEAEGQRPAPERARVGPCRARALFAAVFRGAFAAALAGGGFL